jgi:hypothetical protein
MKVSGRKHMQAGNPNCVVKLKRAYFVKASEECRG